MLDLFSEFATDENLETGGAWFTLKEPVPTKGDQPGQPGTRLLIARANNRAYVKLLNKLLDEHAEQLKQDTEEADKLNEQLLVDVMAETVLMGWEGVVYKGRQLNYSKANAKMLLAMKDFRVRVMGLSSDRAAYKAKEELEQGEA